MAPLMPRLPSSSRLAATRADNPHPPARQVAPSIASPSDSQLDEPRTVLDDDLKPLTLERFYRALVVTAIMRPVRVPWDERPLKVALGAAKASVRRGIAFHAYGAVSRPRPSTCLLACIGPVMLIRAGKHWGFHGRLDVTEDHSN